MFQKEGTVINALFKYILLALFRQFFKVSKDQVDINGVPSKELAVIN